MNTYQELMDSMNLARYNTALRNWKLAAFGIDRKVVDLTDDEVQRYLAHRNQLRFEHGVAA